MGIKIIDGANVTVNTLAVVLYGPPNAGKTSLALTAAKPILFDFDGGVHRAANRSGKAVVRCRSWTDIQDLNAGDIDGFDTIIVDTAGTCVDSLSSDIIRLEPKMGRAGSLTLQGFGALKGRFKKWIDAVRSFGKDVVLVAHASEEQRGDETVERIHVAGSSKQEIYHQADLMGRLLVGDRKERRLTFSPSSTAFGKNIGLDDYAVPPPDEEPALLATIIEDAKKIVNENAVRAAEAHEELAELRERVSKIDSAAGINKVIETMIAGNAPETHRRLIVSVGKERGYEWSQDAKRFRNGAEATAESF